MISTDISTDVKLDLFGLLPVWIQFNIPAVNHYPSVKVIIKEIRN